MDPREPDFPPLRLSTQPSPTPTPEIFVLFLQLLYTAMSSLIDKLVGNPQQPPPPTPERAPPFSVPSSTSMLKTPPFYDHSRHYQYHRHLLATTRHPSHSIPFSLKDHLSCALHLLSELMKAQNKNLGRSKRDLERQLRGLDRQERKLISEIQRLARQVQALAMDELC